MNTRIAAIAAALVLGVASMSTASAFDGMSRHEPSRYMSYEAEYTGSVNGLDTPYYTGCPMSSAAEGNANQQTRPVLQYGRTSGGSAC